jgi:hypothetical protein
MRTTYISDLMKQPALEGAEPSWVGKKVGIVMTYMNRRAIVGAGAAALVGMRLPQASAQSSAPIRIGIAPNDSSLVPLYAREQGFFQQANLNVELQTISNGVAQVVLAGGVDIGVVDCVQIANALIHGFPTVAFAGGCTYSKARRCSGRWAYPSTRWGSRSTSTCTPLRATGWRPTRHSRVAFRRRCTRPRAGRTRIERIPPRSKAGSRRFRWASRRRWLAMVSARRLNHS